MDTAALRIIDASANRAREALRVMEDAARFALNDKALCSRIKSLRHDLRRVLAPFDSSAALLSARDILGDVGASVSTSMEETRTSIADVAVAASKRLAESLRSIEEHAKLFADRGGVTIAKEIERLRHRAYELERLLTPALRERSAPFEGWRLCVIITESLCAHRSWIDVARGAIEGGADCLQHREKSLPDAELLRRATQLVEIAATSTTAVVINDRPDIALLAGANGVHLGQDDLPIERVRRLAPPSSLLIGVSVRTIEQAQDALKHGADLCGVGAMFPTSTKAAADVVGPSRLHEYLAHTPKLPSALAIGGVTPSNIDELVIGAPRRFGVAVSSCVCAAKDPSAACAELIERVVHRTPTHT